MAGARLRATPVHVPTSEFSMKSPLKIVAFALAFACASVAHAQGGRGGGMSQTERTAAQRTRVFEGITLTAEQTKKVDEVYAAQTKMQQEMMAGGGDMRSPEMMAKRQAMTAETTKSIKAILTAEQLVTYEKNVEAMRAARRGPGA